MKKQTSYFNWIVIHWVFGSEEKCEMSIFMSKVEIEFFIIKPYILAEHLSNINCGEYVQIKVHIL